MKELEENSKRLFSSKVSIIGLFAILTLILTVPLVVLLSQEKQDLRGRAQETTAIPTKAPAVGSEVGFISGYVYLDANKNGERETEEKPFPNASVKVTQIQRNSKTAEKNGDAGKVVNTVTRLKTDSLGFFKFRFSNVFPDSITYTVELELPDGYKTIATNPVIFSGMRKDAKETIEFGLFAITAAKSLPVVNSPTPRNVRTQTTSPQVCLDVMTPARNTSTRACNTFGNSCLPAGWIKDASCQISPTPAKGNSNSNSFPSIQGE